MAVPFRYHVAVVLVGLNVVSTAALIAFAYRASRDSLEGQAARAVGVAAREREQAIVRVLDERHERMRAFLDSVISLCAERASSGALAWERECVRVALSGFQTAERARQATLSYGIRRLSSRGSGEPIPYVPAGQLAVLDDADQPASYAMQAARGRLTLRIRLPMDELDAIIRDRSGLDDHGAVSLFNSQGTLVMASGAEQLAGPQSATALRSCLDGTSGEAHVADARRVDSIAGFRPLPAVGGGCIVARVRYDDALVPIHQLGRRFLAGALAFVFLGAGLSLVIARAATRPIHRLADTAHALEAGQFDGAVPISGPTEVRQLGRALASMTRSLGTLIRREHDARLEAESANRTKDQFLALVSHELRTPLTAILGWATILKNRPYDEVTAVRAIDTILRGARTQTRLVDELLDVSRIASGKLQLIGVTQVSCAAIVDAVLETATPAADAKRIEVVRRVDRGTHLVSGDAGRLQQAVGNIVSNAVRFTPPNGRIEVTVADAADSVEIRIGDNGIGIDPVFLPYVFDRFRQADSSTTRSYGGLGLGLAIARNLVELHGGTLTAESAGVGRGATFTIRLPYAVVQPAAADAESPRERSVPPLLEGTHILVVDDDADTRDVVRAILEEAGATVVTTESAEETRECLERARPDVLIADIGMPREDGYSLMRSVRELPPERAGRVPAIALTAHARPEDVEQALASGFGAHLAKPVDSSKLLSAVTSALLDSWTAAGERDPRPPLPPPS